MMMMHSCDWLWEQLVANHWELAIWLLWEWSCWPILIDGTVGWLINLAECPQVIAAVRNRTRDCRGLRNGTLCLLYTICTYMLKHLTQQHIESILKYAYRWYGLVGISENFSKLNPAFMVCAGDMDKRRARAVGWRPLQYHILSWSVQPGGGVLKARGFGPLYVQSCQYTGWTRDKLQGGSRRSVGSFVTAVVEGDVWGRRVRGQNL